MSRILAAAFVVVLGVAAVARAEGPPAPGDCASLSDPYLAEVKNPDAAIAACTRVIQGTGTPRERAIASINRAIAFDAKAGGESFYRANADRDRAAEDLNEAVKLDPKFAFAHYAMGIEEGFGDEALGEFNEAIRLDPNFVLAYDRRGAILEFRDEWERARADFSTAIRLDPQFARSYFGRGVVLRMQGNYDASISDNTEALRLSGEDRRMRSAAANSRGMNYFLKGDLTRAVADFDEALKAEPDGADALALRGLVRLVSGAPNLARPDLTRAVDLAPVITENAVWLEIADRRSHVPGRLAETAKKIDMNTWPAYVIHVLLGDPPPYSILVAANADDPGTKQLQLCQAFAYSGELALLKGAKAEAIEAFTAATKNCGKGSIFSAVAAVELKALAANP